LIAALDGRVTLHIVTPAQAGIQLRCSESSPYGQRGKPALKDGAPTITCRIWIPACAGMTVNTHA
jgi:hypothetical protein